MGCDIHMVLEKKSPFTGNWVGLHGYEVLKKGLRFYDKDCEEIEVRYATYVADGRNYALFRNLANVRGTGEFGYDPKGLPDDASELARMLSEEYGRDGHSHSWHTMLDFLKCYGHSKYEVGSPEHDKACADAIAGDVPYADLFEEVTGVYAPDDMSAETLNKYRVVFWFDN